MKERLEERLGELKREFESGQRLVAELDDKRAQLRENLLRIAGAIQVLEETLTAPADAADEDNVKPLKKAAEGA